MDSGFKITIMEATTQPRWRAKYGEKYWYLSDIGVRLIHELYRSTDNSRYNSLNYYRTESEAISAKKLRDAAPKLLEALEIIGGITENAPELNMVNYNEEQVRELNNAMIEICQIYREAINLTK